MITGRSLFIGGLVSLMATLGACQNDDGSSSDAKDVGIYNGGGESAVGAGSFANASASIDLNNLGPVKEEIDMSQVSHAKIHSDENGVEYAVLIIEDVGPDGQSRRRVYKGEKATQMGGGGGGKVGGQQQGGFGQQQGGFGQEGGFGGQQAGGFGGGGGW